MSELTLSEWWALDDAGRSVAMDALLDRVPPGYTDIRISGNEPGPLPHFVHDETGLVFHVVFGGPAVIGMTPKRLARFKKLARYLDEVPSYEELWRPPHDLLPPHEVQLHTCLVGDQPLPYGVLKKLGFTDEQVNPMGVTGSAVDMLLRLASVRGWRAPSEDEWEYVARIVDDTPADEPLEQPSVRLGWTGLAQMGHWLELCADGWRDEVDDAHEVLRGRGRGRWWGPAHGSDAWFHALWPGRRQRLATERNVSFRPWVDLLP